MKSDPTHEITLHGVKERKSSRMRFFTQIWAGNPNRTYQFDYESTETGRYLPGKWFVKARSSRQAIKSLGGLEFLAKHGISVTRIKRVKVPTC